MAVVATFGATSNPLGGSTSGRSLTGNTTSAKTIGQTSGATSSQLQYAPTSVPYAPAYSGPSAGEIAAANEAAAQQAAAAEAARVEAQRVADLRAGFATQRATIDSSANDAAANTGLQLRESILDLIDMGRSKQGQIDNRGVNNAMAKQRGVADIMGSMSRGIKSGGVTLANRNATDSTAANAIARAYANIGQRQMSDVGNQYELENQEIGLEQEDLTRQLASGQRKIMSSKEQSVNSIVSDAQNQLAALDAAMINASIGDRVAIDQEKNAIRQNVLGQLAQYDSQLSQGVGGIRATDNNARVAEATRRVGLGMAPAEMFDYNTEAPQEFQGTGPFASDLPIFTNKFRRQQ